MKHLFWAIPVLFAGLQVASAATIEPGTVIAVRPDQPIDVHRSDTGRIYPAHVVRDVVARDGDMVVPRGSQAELIVRKTGPGEYSLDIESITVNGRRYALDATGPQFHMRRDEYENGGGIVGAITGAIEGAQGQNAMAHGDHIFVPQDAILNFNLQEPLHVVNWQDPGYTNNGYHYHRDHDWYR